MDYNSFAAIYDRVCPGIEGDVDFFLRRALMAGRVLEIGCGTGRIYTELRKKSINIIGIDSSEEMLSFLRERAQKEGISIEVHLQSMLNLQLSGKYDLIILAYRTFMHLYSTDEQKEVFRQIKSILAPGGEVIIDLFNPDLERINHSSYSLLDSSDPYKLVWLWEEFDIPKQIVRNIFRIEELDSEGRTTATVSKQFQARWTHPEEFRQLAIDSGFKVKTVYADYYCNKFTGTEDKMIWCLESHDTEYMD